LQCFSSLDFVSSGDDITRHVGGQGACVYLLAPRAYRVLHCPLVVLKLVALQYQEPMYGLFASVLDVRCLAYLVLDMVNDTLDILDSL